MKRGLIWLLVLLLCLSAVMPAAAANTFLFDKKSITLFEGETVETVLQRGGKFESGEVTYTSAGEKIAAVSDDGTITGISKGQTKVTATLYVDGKKAAQSVITVKVLRAVKKVTLNTTKLSVYDPDHPFVADLLQKKQDQDEEEQEAQEYQVIVIPAGSTATLATTCTPEDASSKQVTYTSSDAGVAKIAGTSLKAVQRGECDLVIASVQNPEVTETFRILVIQPVKKIQIDAGNKKVAAGSTLQLTAICSPDNASIRDVVWSSKNPDIAEVDENGVVTGLKRGSVNITAKAADGSTASATVLLTVTQPVTGISFAQSEIAVVAGRTTQAKINVYPADASDKTVSWLSSNDEIASVRNGQITGHKAGTCMIFCTSNSNPEVTVAATVTVSQLVTKIECTSPQGDLSLKVGESVQLSWNVLPEDATNKGLTFKSLHPRIATVDASGVVTAVSRGTASIVATAADGSKKQGTVKVNIIQPVTGVTMQQQLYYVQKGWHASIRAIVQPRNANNQKVYWSSVDEDIATVRSNGTSTGSVYGVSKGTTTVTAFTEDGGYTATTQIRVDDFNGAVMIEEVTVRGATNIRITLRNMSRDLVLENVHYKIECYDMHGEPMICNQDEESTYFEGDYPLILEPLERTIHGSFRFNNKRIDQEIGAVVMTIISWRDSDGVTWTIPESERVPFQWVRIKNDRDSKDDYDSDNWHGDGEG